MNTPIKSLLFLVGDDEFADSPAGVNRALFCDIRAKWLRLFQNEHCVAEFNPAVQHAAGGTRMIVAVRFVRPDDTWFIQPFYRSSGMATPERSARGTWWPCSGLYTAAYCTYASIPAGREGYIGKHQWRAKLGTWENHGKDADKIIAPYREAARLLAEVYENTAASIAAKG